ncbi:hypothetical protein HIM_08255 [Hirsutella minnesotensis 3608]|uniref:Versicolorin reductase n=1 Tax=Hirsutella minnesotensis 3608 TaxID=1043627 RepID=A0A0F8A3S3_9HYPO|nr:hypothetical protein HIM_08255 [Hirsutella minnesotensis 3608]
MTAVLDQAYTLKGKVALVTGADESLGRAIAIQLAQRGASVAVIFSQGEHAANEVVAAIEKAGSRAVAMKADVAKVTEVARLFDDTVKHLGRLDIIVSNPAATDVFKAEGEVSEEDFDRVFNLNTRAQFFIAQLGYKHLQENGRIILTSSIAPPKAGAGFHALHVGSKAAVEGFTRSFALDCGPKRVTVNAISPGTTKTDPNDKNAWHYSSSATATQSVSSISPLRTVAAPQDVGKVVAFLSHSDSEWINGQIIPTCGALS